MEKEEENNENVWNGIPDEIIANVASQMVVGTNVKEITNEFYYTMLVCKRWYSVFTDGNIWRSISQLFPDYVRLDARYRASSVSWMELCRERLSSIFMEHEILVGDRENPENRTLIQILGNGDTYIGFVNDFKDDMSSKAKWNTIFSAAFKAKNVKYRGLSYLMYAQYYQIKGIGPKIFNAIDLSNYDPFVLLLGSEGQVLELIYTTSKEKKWRKPSRELEFIKNDICHKMDRVYAMAFACFALSDGHVWTWSIIDHPMPLMVREENRENILTPPICLDMINGFWVYHLEQSDVLNCTRMYYEMRTIVNDRNRHQFRSPADVLLNDPLREIQFIDVSNVDIMYLISKSIFSEDMINEITQKMQENQ